MSYNYSELTMPVHRTADVFLIRKVRHEKGRSHWQEQLATDPSSLLISFLFLLCHSLLGDSSLLLVSSDAHHHGFHINRGPLQYWLELPQLSLQHTQAVRRTTFAIRRTSFAARRTTFTARRTTFAARRTTFTTRRTTFAARRTTFAVRRTALQPARQHLQPKGPQATLFGTGMLTHFCYHAYKLARCSRRNGWQLQQHRWRCS